MGSSRHPHVDQGRPRPKGEALAVLKVLAVAGGDHTPVVFTSREIGERIGVSQQAADRYLLALESSGLITRSLAQRRQRLLVTPAGMELLRTEYHGYRRIFEGPAKVSLSGKVTSGLGEGRYYLSQPGYVLQGERCKRPVRSVTGDAAHIVAQDCPVVLENVLIARLAVGLRELNRAAGGNAVACVAIRAGELPGGVAYVGTGLHVHIGEVVSAREAARPIEVRVSVGRNALEVGQLVDAGDEVTAPHGRLAVPRETEDARRAGGGGAVDVALSAHLALGPRDEMGGIDDEVRIDALGMVGARAMALLAAHVRFDTAVAGHMS
jgi:hypothetical protein